MTVIYNKSQIVFPNTIENQTNVQEFQAYNDDLRVVNATLSTNASLPFKVREKDTGSYTNSLAYSFDNAIKRVSSISTLTVNSIVKDDNYIFYYYKDGNTIKVTRMDVDGSNSSTITLLPSGLLPTGNGMCQDDSFVYVITNTTDASILRKINKSTLVIVASVVYDANVVDRSEGIFITDQHIFITGWLNDGVRNNGTLYVTDKTTPILTSLSHEGRDTKNIDLYVEQTYNDVDIDEYGVAIYLIDDITGDNKIITGSSSISNVDFSLRLFNFGITETLSNSSNPAKRIVGSNNKIYFADNDAPSRVYKYNSRVALAYLSSNPLEVSLNNSYNLGLSDFELNFEFTNIAIITAGFVYWEIGTGISSSALVTKNLNLKINGSNQLELYNDSTLVFTSTAITNTQAYYNFKLTRTANVWALEVNGENLTLTVANNSQSVVFDSALFGKNLSVIFNFSIKYNTNVYALNIPCTNINNPSEEIANVGSVVTTTAPSSSLQGIATFHPITDFEKSDFTIYNLDIYNSKIYASGLDTSTNKLQLQVYDTDLTTETSVVIDSQSTPFRGDSIFTDGVNSLLYFGSVQDSISDVIIVFKTDLLGDLSINSTDFQVQFAPVTDGAFADNLEEDTVDKISLIGIGLNDVADDPINVAVIKHGEGFKDYYKKIQGAVNVNTYRRDGSGSDFIYNKETAKMVASSGTGEYTLVVRQFQPQVSTTIYEAYLTTANIYVDPSLRDREFVKDNQVKAFVATAMSMANMEISWTTDGNYIFNTNEKYVPCRRTVRGVSQDQETGSFSNAIIRLDGSRQIAIKEVIPDTRIGSSFKLKVSARMTDSEDNEVLDEFKIINISFQPAGSIYIGGDNA